MTRVNVTVKDANTGYGIAGAKVTVQQTLSYYCIGAVINSWNPQYTDSSGRVSGFDLGWGFGYKIWVEKTGYETGYQCDTITIGDYSVHEKVFNLNPSGVVSEQVGLEIWNQTQGTSVVVDAKETPTSGAIGDSWTNANVGDKVLFKQPANTRLNSGARVDLYYGEYGKPGAYAQTAFANSEGYWQLEFSGGVVPQSEAGTSKRYFVYVDNRVYSDGIILFVKSTPTPTCSPEGKTENLEYCSDGSTWKSRQRCVGGQWIQESQNCPTPSCNCTAWVNAECVSTSQRKQTRTCNPSKCDVEERVVTDSSCTETPPCTSDANCPTGYKCVNGQCVQVSSPAVDWQTIALVGGVVVATAVVLGLTRKKKR